MNQSFGVFDVFSNAIPGSLYVAATVYVTIRLGLVEVDDITNLDTTLALLGATIASFLLGLLIANPLRHLIERGPLRGSSLEDARREFAGRNPTIAGREFLAVDPMTLLAGVRMHSCETAERVDRSRATGQLLRNVFPAFLIGAVIAVVEAAARVHLLPLVLAALLTLAAWVALREGQKFSRWANLSTFEHAAWLPKLEAQLDLANPQPSPGVSPVSEDG